MSHNYFPALSTFDVKAADAAAVGCDRVGVEIIGRGNGSRDNIQLTFAPSGVSVRGRYWREGPYLKAVVHVQAAAGEPQTITAQVDLRPIARGLKKWHANEHGVRVGGWPGSFIRKVKKIGKSKLLKGVASAVKSVVKSKLTRAAVGATAVVFPPVGVPAAAAYATANSAIAALERANDVKNQARAILAHGTPAQRGALSGKTREIRAALEQAHAVRTKLREIAERARRGDVAARKTARIFSHVLRHRQRVEQYGHKLRGARSPAGVLLTQRGKVVPDKWLRLAARRASTELRRLPP